MYSGYAFFNQTEIWNHNRTLAYMRGDPLNGVPGLRQPTTSVETGCSCESGQPLFCDQGSGPDGEYVSVEADDAPWYDPAVPESVEFAGLFVTAIEGFDSPVRRDVREGAIAGSSLGPLRLAGRTITVTGWLRAKTCCAAEYGLSWLTEALIGGTNCDNCSLGDLRMLKCCPPAEDSECHVSDVSTGQFVDGPDFRIAAADLGAGQYQLVLNDDLQVNLVSDVNGLANNTDGFIPTCLDGVDPLAVASFDLVLDGNAAVTEIQIPYGAITSLITVPSGTGAQATIDIDTTFDTGCDEANDLLVGLTDTLDAIIALFGDGVEGSAVTVTESRCQTIASGPDPIRFNRLMHRVGLVTGPTVTDRFGNCCQADCGCTNLQVQFTLTSELPYLFSEVVWCLQDEPFPRSEIYCIDFNFCDNCGNIDPTQLIEVERPRPECRVTVRYDGTWCPDGWNPNEVGFPPAECLLVPVVEEFVPTAATGSATGDPCLIDLQNGGTWTPVNFDPADGFVPEHCDLTIRNPNGGPFGCADQDQSNCTSGGGSGNLVCEVTLAGAGTGGGTWTAAGFNPAVKGFPPDCCDLVITPACPDPATECPVRLIYDVCTGAQTWETLCFDGGCDCYVVAETCITGAETCLVKVIYDSSTGAQTWEPIRWDGDINNACCVCYEIAEVEVIAPAADCPPVALVECGINLTGYNAVTNKGTYDKIGWSWVPADGDFPPADCNITIPGQDTSPVTVEIEVPGGLFVPDCGPTPIVPPAPFAPFEECYCEPWGTYRVCCTFEHEVLWNDATTYIEVTAGSAEIRNMKIQAFQNPFAAQGLPCPCDPQDEFWRCREPCSTILIPQLPSGSKIVLDGRSRVSDVTFAGGQVANGLRYIASEGGRPFEWFDIGQCATLCIIVSADCSIAEDATVSIGLSERYLASGG